MPPALIALKRLGALAAITAILTAFTGTAADRLLAGCWGAEPDDDFGHQEAWDHHLGERSRVDERSPLGLFAQPGTRPRTPSQESGRYHERVNPLHGAGIFAEG